MRAYRKPTMEIECFDLNQAITTCERNSNTSYEPVTVDCMIKSGSVENVFWSNMGCGYIPANKYLITVEPGTTYNWQGSTYSITAGTYLIWTGHTSGFPSAEGSALQDYLRKKAGISSSTVIHAGLATPKAITVFNAS